MLVELVELQQLEIICLRKVVASLKIKALVQTRAIMVLIVLNRGTILGRHRMLAPKLRLEEIGSLPCTLPAARTEPCSARHGRRQPGIVPRGLDPSVAPSMVPPIFLEQRLGRLANTHRPIRPRGYSVSWLPGGAVVYAPRHSVQRAMAAYHFIIDTERDFSLG